MRYNCSGIRGFALPVVVFFMVVVAMLVAAMTRLSVLSRTETDLELQAERAHWVALSASHYLYHLHGRDSAPPCSIDLPAADGFRVVIEECTGEPRPESGPVTLTLRAETSAGDIASPDYVSSRQRVTVP